MPILRISAPKDQFRSFWSYHLLLSRSIELPRLPKFLTVVFGASAILGYLQTMKIPDSPTSPLIVSLIATFAFAAFYLSFYLLQHWRRWKVSADVYEDNLQCSNGKTFKYKDFARVQRIDERILKLEVEKRRQFWIDPSVCLVFEDTARRDLAYEFLKSRIDDSQLLMLADR